MPRTDTSRSTFKALAKCRLVEATCLFGNRQYDGAYYLAGYSIECALKAIACKRFQRAHLPDKKFVQSLYTHDLKDLVAVCGLASDLRVMSSSNRIFAANWRTVSDWDESSRYKRTKRVVAQDMVDAVGDPVDGVLEWLKRHW